MNWNRWAAVVVALLVLAGGRFGAVFSQSGRCAVTLSNPSASIDSSGVTGFSYLTLDVSLSGGVGCYWTASTSDAWVSLLSVTNPSSARPGLTNAGDGTLTMQVQPNTGSARTGTVTIASDFDSKNYLIQQAGTSTPPPTGAPTLTQVSPSQAAVSTFLNLIAVGSNFSRGAQIRWTSPSGTVTLFPTTFASSATLQATISASTNNAAGDVQVAVVNPDGQVSNSRVITVIGATPPPPSSAPTLTSISPTSGTVNTAVTIQAQGANFPTGAQMRWTPPGGNASNLPATLQSSSQLQATVPATLMTTPGTGQVAVLGSNGAVSNSLSFTVTGNATGPVLDSISPTSGTVNTAVTIQAQGSNFPTAAQMRWTPPGGTAANLPATLQSSAQLQATVPATLMTTPGTGQVAVLGSNGAVSNSLSFTVNALGLDCTSLPPVIPDGVSPVTRGVVTTVAGTDWVFPGDGGKAKDAPIHDITGIAADLAGRVYFSDNGNHMVMMVDTDRDRQGDRILRVVAGTGIPAFAGDDGPARLASFEDLRGLASDAAGNLYVADGLRVRRISAADGSGNRTVTTIAGNGACCASPSDGVDARTVGMNPVAIAADPGGNVYVYSNGQGLADNRIYRITSGTGPGLSTVLNATAQKTAEIQGLAVTSDSTVYAGVNAPFATLLRIVPGAAPQVVLSRIPDVGAGDIPPYIYRLASDSQNNLLISSTNGLVLKVDLSQSPVQTTTLAGTRTVWSYRDGSTSQAQFNAPRDLAADSAGAVYVVDGTAPRTGYVAVGQRIGYNHRIRQIAADRSGVSTLAGNGKFRYGGDGGPAVRATLDTPRGLAVDGGQNLAIVDFGNNRVRSVAPNGTITTKAGNDTQGASGDGGPAANASFGYIGGIAPIPANPDGFREGGVLISDPSAQSVRYIDNRTGLIDKWPGQVSQYPFSLAFLPSRIAVLFASFQPNGIFQSIFNRAPSAFGKVAGQAALWDGSRAVALDYSPDRNPGGTLYADNGAPWTLSDDGLAFGPGKASILRKVDVATESLADFFALPTLPGLPSDVTKPYFTALAADSSNGDFGGSVWAGVNLDIKDPNSASGTGTRGSLLWLDKNGRVNSGLLGKAGGPVEGVPLTDTFISSVGGMAVDPGGNVYYSDDRLHRVRKVLASPPAASLRNPSNPTGPALPAAGGGKYSAELRFSGSSNGAPTGVQRVLVSTAVPAMPVSILAAAGSEAAPCGASACTATSGVPWLRINTRDGLTPLQLEISADPFTLGRSDAPYEATITICVPNSAQPQQTVHVLLTVGPQVPPRISTAPRTLSLAASAGTASVSDTVLVSNNGGGEEGFSGFLEREQKGTFIRIGSPQRGSVRAGDTVKIPITVPLAGLSAGTYVLRYRVVPDNSSAPAPLPITLTVSNLGQILKLSQRGLSFTAVTGGLVVPEQSFAVLNLGSEAMAWTVSTKVLASTAMRQVPNWLTVSPDRGTSGPGLATQFVTVTVKPDGLAAGSYEGYITVNAAGARNAPHFVSVYLTVLADDPGAAVLPAALSFSAVQGGSPPSARELKVFNIGRDDALSFGTTLSLDNGRTNGDWLVSLPGDAVVPRSAPLRVLVQPLTAKLPAGNYTASVTLRFSDGKSRLVPVRIAIQPGAGASPSASKGSGSLAADGDGCVADRIIPQIATLPGGFLVNAGWPMALQVITRDNCDRPVSSGTVEVRMSGPNVDETVPLRNLGGGRWDNSWPGKSSPGDLTLTATATDDSGRLKPGSTTVSGSLSSTAGDPVFDESGVTSAAEARPLWPVAPGERLSIVGQRLASASVQCAQGTNPCELTPSYPISWPPNPDDATIVTIGSKFAVLRNVTPDALDVIVPFGIAADAGTQQMLIQRGLNNVSVARDLTITAAQPAIFVDPQPAIARQGRIYYPANGQRLATDGNEAAVGQEVAIVCTGLGGIPNVTDQALASWSDALSVPSDISITIGGVPVSANSQRMRPGKGGEYVILVNVPGGTQGTPAAGGGTIVDVVLTAGDRSSIPVSMVVK